MLDDDSDLTDIDDDDDEYKERKAPGPKKATVGTNYRIRKALKVPRATTYTAQALYEQIHNSDINLEPEYQRDVVWPESKQIGIIDSVFRNFYIPPVIFVVNSLEDGSETKTCIDGKQRLTSIHRFMDGLIPHKDSVTGEKLWYTDVAPDAKTSRARKLLPEKYRRVFANKQIVCVEYQDITENDEREIFQRVQLGMALTPAEKLQVISSPRATLIRGLLATFLTEDNSDALSWERARGADFRCLAQAAYCISGYDLGVQNLGTALQLEKWLAQPGDPDPALVKKVKDTYRLFAELVLDKKLNKPFKQSQKVSPVEFIAISILIAVHKDDMSMAQLAVAIGEMRDKVRDKHDDIRTNAKVAKTLLDFIRDLKPGKNAGPPAGSTTAVVKQEKRKRNDVDDEEPVKRKPKKPTPPRASSSATASSSVRSLPTPTPKPPSLTQLPAPAPAPVPTPTPKPRTHPLPSRRDSAPQLPPTAPAHDRMAALRAAKNNMAALSITPSLSAPATFAHFPHLLPTGAGTSSTSPRITRDTSLEASIMALASRPDPATPVLAGGWSASSRYGPEAEYASRERDRDRDGDRDKGRDRDRDRDRNRDRDRERDREREREREKKAERDWEKEMEYRANASGRGGRSGRGGG